MSDRATINIDCERGEVTSACDELACLSISSGLEETKSILVMRLLIPEIKRLMGMSKMELRKAYTTYERTIDN